MTLTLTSTLNQKYINNYNTYTKYITVSLIYILLILDLYD
jgi:hypothetical protein